MNRQKRVVTSHDISCMGRCSITVALPILSALGIETIILPTSILSTHTSGFKNFTYLDLKDESSKITKHWENYKREIDAVYTGFLGSIEQINILKEYISKHVALMREIYPDYKATVEFRKFVPYYFKGLDGVKQLKLKLVSANSTQEILDLIEQEL